VSFTASAVDLVDGPVTVQCAPPSGSTFPLGTTTVTCTAIDAHGNTATATFTVKVQDTTPPAIGAAPDVTAEATGPTGAVVTFPMPAATDAVGPVTVTCDPASGSLFSLGETMVTCTAVDGAGNAAT